MLKNLHMQKNQHKQKNLHEIFFSSMNKNIHVITTTPENADKYSYMQNYIHPFSHKSKKCPFVYKFFFFFQL